MPQRRVTQSKTTLYAPAKPSSPWRAFRHEAERAPGSPAQNGPCGAQWGGPSLPPLPISGKSSQNQGRSPHDFYFFTEIQPKASG